MHVGARPERVSAWANGNDAAILLPGIGRAAGLEIAERLRACVEDANPHRHPHHDLGLSGGTGGELEYDTLFKAADEALYEAKWGGRNRVAVAPLPFGDADTPMSAVDEKILASLVE
ncbi:MAG: diguanylate cyclase domain-containing protein [Solirubrobacteraceae bacterium]